VAKPRSDRHNRIPEVSFCKAKGRLESRHQDERIRARTVFDVGMNALGQTPIVRAISLCVRVFCFFPPALLSWRGSDAVLEQSCDVRFEPSTDIALDTKIRSTGQRP
jgi:hypothetical protein